MNVDVVLLPGSGAIQAVSDAVRRCVIPNADCWVWHGERLVRFSDACRSGIPQRPIRLGAMFRSASALPGDWVFFLSSNSEVSPDWKQELIEAIQEHEGSQGVAAEILWVRDGRTANKFEGEPYPVDWRPFTGPRFKHIGIPALNALHTSEVVSLEGLALSTAGLDSVQAVVLSPYAGTLLFLYGVDSKSIRIPVSQRMTVVVHADDGKGQSVDGTGAYAAAVTRVLRCRRPRSIVRLLGWTLIGQRGSPGWFALPAMLRTRERRARWVAAARGRMAGWRARTPNE